MINQLRESAKERINQACETFKVLNIAFSSGKDSSALLLMVVGVLLERKTAGLSVPVLYVTTSSTKIESVPVQDNIEHQHRQINAFCATNGLECYTAIPSPEMGNDFVGIISGRGFMPSPLVKSHSCTLNWKISPQQKARKSFMKEHGYGVDDVVILIGSRSDESTNRKKNVSKRGHELGGVVFDEKNKEHSIAPIVDWTSDDVWELIAEATNGMIPTWDSLEKTLKIYRAAAGGECPIVAGDSLAQSGGCGSSRTGCFLCTAIDPNNSSDSKIAEDPEFAFTSPLHNIQLWLSTVIHDYDKRTWISRSVFGEDGVRIHPTKLASYKGKCFIKIAPQYYSAEVVRNLFRYVLSAQMDETEFAEENGIEKRFSFLTLEEVLYIDLKWSERGIAKPYAALHDLHEIMELGKRYYPDIANLAPVEYKPISKPKYLEVPNFYGTDFYFKGLHDSMSEFTGGAGHTNESYENNGKVIKNPNGISIPEHLNLDSSFKIDTENLWYIEDCLSEYSEWHKKSNLGMTAGIRHFMRLGIISLSSVTAKNLDLRLRMHSHLRDAGYLEMSNTELYSMATTVEFDVPEKVMKLSDIPVVQANHSLEQLDLFELVA